jgi:hypothetical protein
MNDNQKAIKENTRAIAEAVSDNLKSNGVGMTDMTGQDDESVIYHDINVDLALTNDEKIRLTLTYDGWSLVLRHSDGSRTSFGKEIKFRTTNEDYYASVVKEVVRATLAFSQGHIAGVVHLENDIPKIVQLYERTKGGYQYLTWFYTMNPPTGFFAKEDKKFYKKDGNYAMHPKCDAVEVLYDTSPAPQGSLALDTRQLFASMSLRTDLTIQKEVKDLHDIKPINQEIVLLDC